MTKFDGGALSLSIGGESHGPCVWGTVRGLPPGGLVNLSAVAAFTAKRAPGGAGATRRNEPDDVEIITGLAPLPQGQCVPSGNGLPSPNGAGSESTPPCRAGLEPEGPASPAEPLPPYSAPTAPPRWAVVTGDELEARIANKDARPRDYDEIRCLPRPSHADYAAAAKYGPGYNPAGGGPFSGRLTAPLCFLGGVAMELLRARGVAVAAHLLVAGDVFDDALCPTLAHAGQLTALAENNLPFLSKAAQARALAAMEAARNEGDSLAGTVEAAVYGLPAGACGGPVFEGLEGRIAPLLFAIPGLKGLGFGACPQGLRGSEYNDGFLPRGSAAPCAANHHGGILGGISSGMPITLRAYFKPTPSIALPQQTVNLATGEGATLTVPGRHDPCIALRGTFAVQAALALGVLDAILYEEKQP